MVNEAKGLGGARYHAIAARIRELTQQIQFNPRYQQQLLALADGFDRLALREDQRATAATSGAGQVPPRTDRR
jgi:hypothetical protein